MYQFSFWKYALLASFLFTTFSGCQKVEITPLGVEKNTVKQQDNSSESMELPAMSNYFFGDDRSLGEGIVLSYAKLNDDGSPQETGIAFTQEMLESLPQTLSDKKRCFDRNANGFYDEDECTESHEVFLKLPRKISAMTPFNSVLLRWRPNGHASNDIYSAPHFEVHFQILSQEELDDIKTGSCANLMDCRDFDTAMKQVPANFVPANFLLPRDGSTVEPGRGGQLIDLLSPEICCDAPFKHKFGFGAYNGRISSYNPTFSLDYLNSRPNDKVSIRSPQAYEITGYYPAEYRIQYDAKGSLYKVTLNEFVFQNGQVAPEA